MKTKEKTQVLVTRKLDSETWMAISSYTGKILAEEENKKDLLTLCETKGLKVIKVLNDWN